MAKVKKAAAYQVRRSAVKKIQNWKRGMANKRHIRPIMIEMV